MPDNSHVQTNPHLISAPLIAQFAQSAGWSSQSDIATATAIALAESGGKSDATNKNSNGTTDYGLWQINSIHKDALAIGDWKDPSINAKMAYMVYKQAGNSFKPWVTFNNGHYKDHLSGANPASYQVTGTSAKIPNPLDAIGSAIVKLGADMATVLVILVFLVLGVVLLLRKPIGKVAGATPIGRVSKTITKVAG